VAWPDNNPNSQALPKFGQNTERTNERGAGRSPVNKSTAPVTIKVKQGAANPPPRPATIKKHYNIFVVVYKLFNTVHMDQTGAFPITLQQGCWYIMVGIHSGCKLYLLQINEE
jgi:hypothetical protein